MIPLYGRYNDGLIPIQDWNTNTEEVAQSCLIGPQGELIEMIQQFNNKYKYYLNENDPIIGITKKFFWKRGSYDSVKLAYTNGILNFSMKNSGMSKMKSRINNNSWRERNFWQLIERIENKMIEFRRQGMSWMDNTDIVNSYTNVMKERIIRSLAANPFPNIELEMYINDNPTDPMQHKIVLLARIKDINIKIKHAGEVIGNVKTDDILLSHEFFLWSHINSHCSAEEPYTVRATNNNPINSLGKLETMYYSLRHPYVSRRYSHHNNTTAWTNICMGDHDAAWRGAISNLNIDVMLHYMNSWANNYEIPSTNPLNKIHDCFFGLPTSVPQKVIELTIGGRDGRFEGRTENCQFPVRYFDELYHITSPESSLPVTDNNGFMPNTNHNSFVGDYYNEDYANVLVNHCNDCQYNKECKKSLTIDDFLYSELSWDSSQYHKASKVIENFDDKLDEYYMRQQMIMHLAAHDIFRRGVFSVELTERCHNQHCISSIEEDLQNLYHFHYQHLFLLNPNLYFHQ